ncbi:pyocin knob domain-containing protein [Thioclava sp. GXIMD2076]|uniref:pyocin knob domain-containing protein n=1 Tax=Thioclava sp. GXIMD2076 TaxID=3131931 RepID=UPI0030D3AD99
MAKPTYTPPPNEAPILGDPSFAAKAQGFLGWFPVMGEYMQGMGDWIETMIGDVPSDNIAAFAHLNGAANKLPYFTGAGAMAMADLTADGRSLMGQSGTLKASGGVLAGTGITQSDLDTTPQRLLKVGDNGILGPFPTMSALGITSIDDIPAGVSCTSYGSTDDLPEEANLGLLITRGNNAGTVYQDFFQTYPYPGAQGRAWRRLRYSGTWGEWVRLFTEYGSNSNGAYVRHPDGTQQCWLLKSLYYDQAQRLKGTWTYPAAFTASPVCEATLQSETLISSEVGLTSLSNIGVRAPSTTSTEIFLYRAGTSGVSFASGDTCQVHVRATGRWK